LIKGWIGVASLASCLVMTAATQAQDLASVPRERTLVTVGWSAGSPTLSAPNNGNWYSLGAELRNGIMFVNEPLFTYNHFKGEHIPWLAESYQYNDDYTSITVRLREGAKWSDGEAFDAEDVAYTLNMLVDNGKGKKDLRKAIEVANQVKDAVVVDPLTVQITLVKPDPRYVYRGLTNYFGHGLIWLPEHIWKDVEDHANFTFLDLEMGWPVGTGAWKVVANTPNEIVLDRRDDWWGAATGFRPLPAPERIISVPAPDNERNAQLVVANQIDATHTVPSPSLLASILDQNDKITTFAGRQPPYGYMDWWPHSLYFNHMAEDSPFQDIRVRKAVMHAVNREQLIEFAWDGANQPNLTPYPHYEPLMPFVEVATEIAKKHGFDVEDISKTAELMLDAGYAKDDEGFWAKDGKRVGGPLEAQPALAAVGQVVTQQLRKAGFDAQYSQTPDSFRKFRAGESQWHLFGHNGGSVFDPLDTLRMYKTENQSPIGTITFFVARWSDPEFDKLVDQMELLPPGDPGLMPLFEDAMEIWYGDVVEVPLELSYHLNALNQTYWTNWPSQDNAYGAACVSCFISGWGTLLAHYLQPVQ